MPMLSLIFSGMVGSFRRGHLDSGEERSVLAGRSHRREKCSWYRLHAVSYSRLGPGQQDLSPAPMVAIDKDGRAHGDVTPPIAITIRSRSLRRVRGQPASRAKSGWRSRVGADGVPYDLKVVRASAEGNCRGDLVEPPQRNRPAYVVIRKE